MPFVIKRANLDRIGAYASAICAVHCLITGIALGLLSYAGLGFMGSITADIAFLTVAVGVASLAIVHGIRQHHSYKPASIFALGLAMVVMGHFVFRHQHSVSETGFDLERVLSTVFSVLGGLCFVLFHVMNMRMQKTCGCRHCATGE